MPILSRSTMTPDEKRVYNLAWYHANKNTPKAIAAREARKPQKAAQDKAYREANVETLRVKDAARRAKNRAKKAEYDKAYRETNRVRISERDHAYRNVPENQERARVRSRQWVADNPERKRKQNREYYEANKDEILVQQQEYYKINKAVLIPKMVERNRKSKPIRKETQWYSRLLSEAKQSSKGRGHAPPSIDTAFIRSLYESQGGKCYWTGMAMTPSQIPRDPLQPSIDRLDNSLGYEPGNVVLTTYFANHARREMSVSQFRAVLEILREVILSDATSGRTSED